MLNANIFSTKTSIVCFFFSNIPTCCVATKLANIISWYWDSMGLGEAALPKQFSGRILIHVGGTQRDISDFSLRSLRAAIGMVPKEPGWSFWKGCASNLEQSHFLARKRLVSWLRTTAIECHGRSRSALMRTRSSMKASGKLCCMEVEGSERLAGFFGSLVSTHWKA